MNYNDYQAQVASEKLTLAILNGSKRLMAWTLHSGNVYKLINFTAPIIARLEDSGNAYTSVSSVADLTPSTYFNDVANSTIYIQTTGSDNPNGRFIVCTQKYFFSNAGIVLPHDLNTGDEVYFEPMVKSTSSFGVAMDTVNQASEAIEGAGTLSLHNDNVFWPKNFDKVFFDNHECYIYSYNRELAPTEAKLIFRGRVEKKTYSNQAVTLSLKDILSDLRAPVVLKNIGDLVGARTPANEAMNKQRMLFGRVYGYRPLNIDQVLDGYPVAGTVSLAVDSTAVTGVGTSFLAALSPGDQLVFGSKKLAIESITTDTALILAEAYSGEFLTSIVNGTTKVLPQSPKRYINRKWLVAGHPVREPSTQVIPGSTIQKLRVLSTADMYAGDDIYIGTPGAGELATIESVINSTQLKLTGSLNTIPATGTVVTRPGVQNVRINDVRLTYIRDYTFDATSAVLTLLDTAEANAAPIRRLGSSLNFTAGTQVTGTGLTALLKAGDLVTKQGQLIYHEIESVVSDTEAKLRTVPAYAGTGAAAGYFKSLVYNEGDDVLTCDVLGRTEDGTSNGPLIKDAPTAVKVLMQDAGLTTAIDLASFEHAKGVIGDQEIGQVIPLNFDEKSTPSFRDVINRISKSTFASLVQTEAFKLSYIVLRPNKASTALKLREEDILSFSIESTAQNMVKTAIVQYNPKEYDYTTQAPSVSTQQKTSSTSTHILKTTRERVFETCLVDQRAAEVFANRWAFILEQCATTLKLRTKLQAIDIEVGDIIEVEHRKLYERLGSVSSRKLCLVEGVKKSGTDVEIEAVDLSNAFNRVACISTNATEYGAATEDEKLYGGYVTDDFGVIGDDPDSFGSNSIW